MPIITKEKRISDELSRISLLFEKVDGNQKTIVTPLLQNAAFMKVTLEDLQEIINSEGVTDEYKNGANQYGVKQSATLQSYNALVKNYAAVIKALSQLLPPEKKAPVASSIQQAFCERHRPKTEEEQAAYRKELEDSHEQFIAELRRIREGQN